MVFAANHQSFMDTPVIMSVLPARWRYRLAPAMAKEFFDAHFKPGTAGWFTSLRTSVGYYLAALAFNAFPLPQREAGARQTLRYMGELVDAGYSILIFPEGHHTDTGGIDRFKAGIGMIAARLNVTVVPVRLEGVESRPASNLADGAPWPCAGEVRQAVDAGRRRLRGVGQESRTSCP